MEKLIDVNKEKKASERRFIIHIALILLLFISVIAVDIILLFVSSLDYLPNLIIDIVITCLLVIIVIFYFINIFPLDFYYYRLFKKMNATSLEHHRRLKYLKEIEQKDIEKVHHRVLQFSYVEGENEYVLNLYVLDNDVSFKEDYLYKIDAFQNIIVRYEAL